VPDTIYIDELTPDAENVRRRTERSTEVIANSLKQFGAGRSIVLDRDGVVRAGNGTVEGAKAAGIDRVRVIESDGSELIAIKRTDLSGADATAYAIADNRAADLSTWDFEGLDEQLGSLVDAEFDIDAIGFNEDELAGMLDKTPEFDPADESDQGQLDSKKLTTCPNCNHEF